MFDDLNRAMMAVAASTWLAAVDLAFAQYLAALQMWRYR